MKTKILSLAIAALAFSSFSSFAQAPGNTKADKKTERVAAKPGKEAKAFNPFEGINLSAEQQSKLDALKADRQKARETAKADRKKAREERRKASIAKRKAHLEQIKSILTPEQYVAYLENIALNRFDGHKGHKMHIARKDVRKGQKGRNGHKGQRPRRGAAQPETSQS